jgi:Domain of unknown function (DUF4157)
MVAPAARVTAPRASRADQQHRGNMGLERAQRLDMDSDGAADAARTDEPDRLAVPGKRTRVEQLFEPGFGREAQRTAHRASHAVPGRQTLVEQQPPEVDEPGRLPGELRRAIEALSGFAMDDVRVHYNSSRPAQLAAAAYAHGHDIYLGPGQAHQLGHEAWHVVQQKQGRVAVSWQIGRAAINADPELEHEADVMAARASERGGAARAAQAMNTAAARGAVYQLAPLGHVDHIRDSCFIATIINTFAVTPTFRNLINPAANDLTAVAPLARLQNLLHRAVNTVDLQQPVSAEWVAGIMTALVANAIIADPYAQDVNEVLRALVSALQNGAHDAGQGHGVRAYAGDIPWPAGRTVQESLQGGAATVPFDPLHPANVIHIARAPHNHQVAPDSFTVQLPNAEPLARYYLRSAVNRDVGSYDQSHFISYANRGTNAVPEWHENDDVGPRRRPIPDLDNVQTDPVMIEERRKELTQRGLTDKEISTSKEAREFLAPTPINVRGGSVMYIYERDGVVAQAGPDGEVRHITNDVAIPNATAAFTVRYYQMMYAHRAQLDTRGKTALLRVLSRGQGFDIEIQTLHTEIVQQMIAPFTASAASLLELPKEQLAEPSGIAPKELAKLPVLEAEKAILDAYTKLLKRGKKGKKPDKADRHQLDEPAGKKVLTEVGALLEQRTAKEILTLSEAQLLLLAGWEEIPMKLKGAHLQKKPLSIQQIEFHANLNTLLDDPITQASLAPPERDRLLAIHHYLGADSAVSSSSKIRGGEDGIPDESTVTYDKSFELFAPSSPLSETDDDPVEPDVQAELARKKGRFSLFSTATFGNHVPQVDDERVGRDNFSGLGPANTTAFVMRGGRLVPRMIGPVLAPQPNTGGHRRALGVLGEDREAYAATSAHGKLDTLAGNQDKVYADNPTRHKKARHDAEKDRRGMRHALSGSVMWTEQSALRDGEEAEDLEREREQLAPQVDETTGAGPMIKRYAGKRAESLDHAESQVVRTQLWRALTAAVIQAVAGEGVVTPGDVSLQLFLNRSSCQGCGRRLMLEAIRFWTELAQATHLLTWQAARDRFRGEVRLEVGFSGNYFDDDPATFRAIAAGLFDAGWKINVLARHRTTDEFSRQTVTTLTQLNQVIESSPSPDTLRKQLGLSKRVEAQVGDHASLKQLFGVANKHKRPREDDPAGSAPSSTSGGSGLHDGHAHDRTVVTPSSGSVATPPSTSQGSPTLVSGSPMLPVASVAKRPASHAMSDDVHETTSLSVPATSLGTPVAATTTATTTIAPAPAPAPRRDEFGLLPAALQKPQD